MKKLFKIINLKRLIYLLFAVSWVYFLTIVSEIKDDLRTVKRYASEVIRVQTQLNGISTELESIDKKLKYDFSSIYIDSYEGIKHFRYNRETGKINKRDSRSFGGWGSPFGSDD